MRCILTMNWLYTPSLGADSGVHVGCDLPREVRRGLARTYKRTAGTDLFYVTSNLFIEVVLCWCLECWMRYKEPLGVY